MITVATTAPIRCPVCHATEARKRREHTIAEVATHFVPASRDRRGHEELRNLLAVLWPGEPDVSIYECRACSFGFAVPFISGDSDFYNLVSGSRPRYPGSRWEFRRTLDCLRARSVLSSTQETILEIGAGEGAFLEQVRAELGDAYRAVAIEYNSAAVERLRAAGFEAEVGDFRELATQRRLGGPFAAICLFQSLEHIADVHSTFDALRSLVRDDGEIYVSVPYGPAVELQESLVEYWDMPPNHVGRWTRSAFEVIAGGHGLAVVDWELEPVARPVSAWRLATYGVLAKAYDEKTLAGRVNAWDNRWLRGPAKRILALGHLPRTLAAWRRLCPATQWVRLAPGEDT